MGNSSSSQNGGGGGRSRDSGSAIVTGNTSGAASLSNAAGVVDSPPRATSAAAATASTITGTPRATGPSEAMSGSSRSLAAAANSAALAAAEAAKPTLYAQDARVDNGHLVPLSNIYPTSPQDWIHDTVQKLIVDRKLAPFYRGLEDWDGEDSYDRDEIDTALDAIGDEQSQSWRKGKMKAQERLDEAAMYKKASECPICFLYYPPLINTSRCCDQPICTECFVQIKRADPTTTNLISEPAACPYCVEPNFGVTYIPPPPARRTGLGAPKSGQNAQTGAPKLTRSGSSTSATGSDQEMGPAAAAHARRKSVSHTAAEVVTVDMIQADWEAKLAAVRATAARRAARRVVFRQVGDRLVPVGISSGRELNPNTTMIDDQGRIILTGPIPIVGQSGYSRSSIEAASAAAAAGGSLGGPGDSTSSPGRLLGRGRRSRGQSHGQNDAEGHRILNMGGDLEELMVMEAMRLSMLEEEERRKKAEKEAKAAAKKEKKEGHGSTASGAKRLLGAVTGSSSHSHGTAGGESSKAASQSSGRSSPRVSFDQQPTSLPRGSSETSRPTSITAPTASTSTASTSNPSGPASSSAGGLGSNNPYASSSRIGGNSRSSFLRMPPMQRNDSSASMTQLNLPAPLVPAKASSPPPGSQSGQSSSTGPRRLTREEEEDLL